MEVSRAVLGWKSLGKQIVFVCWSVCYMQESLVSGVWLVLDNYLLSQNLLNEYCWRIKARKKDRNLETKSPECRNCSCKKDNHQSLIHKHADYGILVLLLGRHHFFALLFKPSFISQLHVSLMGKWTVAGEVGGWGVTEETLVEMTEFLVRAQHTFSSWI